MKDLPELLPYLTLPERAEMDSLLLGQTNQPERITARNNLLEFCKHVDRDYEAAAHLVLLSSYLAQVERYVQTKGREGIGRLIVNMPPRHGKSQTISKRWPAYLLGRHPEWHLGLVAYGDELAADFSRANRYLCDASPEYHELFPNIKLHPSSSAVHRWALDGADQDNPSVVATGIGGVLTGRGFQVIVIDDPIKNRQEADSQAYRDHLKDAYKGAIRTRLEPGGAIVLVCTRWHEDDLAGYLLDLQRQGKGERWVIINLPAIAETNDLLGRKPGEALWSARFDLENLLATQSGIDDYEWQAQFMGRPVSPSGAVFKREWWREDARFNITDMGLVRTCVGRWISFDTAMKDEVDNAYTSCTVGELWPDYRMAVREVWRERLEFPELPDTIAAIARRYNADGKLRGVIIEDKASGTSAYQTLMASSKKWLKRLLVAFQPSGDKTQRARQASVWCRNGCVLLPWPNAGAPWLADFEDELFSFPTSAFKDQVDSFSQLIIYTEKLLEEGWQARGGES